MKDALKELRRKSGLSQADVACVLGIQQPTVSMWETGENMPRASILPKLAELYRCNINDLYGKGGKT